MSEPTPMDEALYKSAVSFCVATLMAASAKDSRIYLACALAIAEGALRALALSAKEDKASAECQQVVHEKLRQLLFELRPEDLQ